MSDAPSLEPDDELDDADHEAEDIEFAAGIVTPYEAMSERLNVYGGLIRVMLPRIGVGFPADQSREPDLDDDVKSARNLALIAIFSDMRRIAGDGRPVHDPEEC